MYTQFAACVLADLVVSARIRQNGLEMFVPDLLQYMFHPKLIEVPADLATVYEQLIASDSSFVVRLSRDVSGQS